MFTRIRVVLWGIKYSIEKTIAFERVIKGLQKRRMFSFKKLRKGELFKLNPWIEYVATHSMLSYVSVIDLYDKLIGLPWKVTRRRARLLTKLIIDQANSGVVGTAIDVGTIAALIECLETKKGAKK